MLSSSVRQFVDPVGDIKYSLPTAGGTTHVICVGAQNALILELFIQVQIVAIDHFLKVCLISLTEIVTKLSRPSEEFGVERF
jgi:hypothetical protein